MEFRHTHGLGGMLNISTLQMIDVIQTGQLGMSHNQDKDAKAIPCSPRKKSNLELLRHHADEEGYLALLDTYIPYLITNPNPDFSDGDDAEIPNNVELGCTEWQGIPVACSYPIPAYDGSKPSPLATNIIFHWCDGVRSNVMEALKRNEDFQRRGNLHFNLTYRSLAFKDFILGNGVWNSYMNLWYQNQADIVRKFEVTESTDGLGEADWEDEESIYDSRDYESMDPKSLWRLQNADFEYSPRLADTHYKSIDQIKDVKASWSMRRFVDTRCNDVKSYKLFRRYVKLNPNSALGKAWAVREELERSGDERAWLDYVNSDEIEESHAYAIGEAMAVRRLCPQWQE
ncbi:MAG: hypothetical protein Q9160_009034 [Pyrenula sp. 1 TL-2023]